MTLGTAARPGAAQGPHGEGGDDATAGVERPRGTEGGGRRPADAKGWRRPPDRLFFFGGSGGKRRGVNRPIPPELPATGCTRVPILGNRE